MRQVILDEQIQPLVPNHIRPDQLHGPLEMEEQAVARVARLVLEHPATAVLDHVELDGQGMFTGGKEQTVAEDFVGRGHFFWTKLSRRIVLVNMASASTPLKTKLVSGIYAIVNRNNRKAYIGSAVDIGARWRGHRWELRNGKHHSRYLQRAYNKEGDVFDWEILEFVADRNALIQREQLWLDFFKTYRRDQGYNLEQKADSSRGVKWPLERRIAASISRTGAKRSESARQNMKAAQRSRDYSAVWTPKRREAVRKQRLGTSQKEESKGKAKQWFLEHGSPRQRGVIRLSDNGNPNAHFRSMSEAARASGGISGSAIGVAIREKRKAFGFFWRMANG